MNDKLFAILSICEHYDAVNFWSGIGLGFVSGAGLTALFLWVMG